MTAERPDVIDRFHHDHAHLHRLFADIEATFAKLAQSKGDDLDHSMDELVEVAAEDLNTALEEMLHHFNHEEEVFFVAIEKQFPQYSTELEQLVESHEAMCSETRWLRKQLSQGSLEIRKHAPDIFKRISQVRKALEEHNQHEKAIFEKAIDTMDSEQRSALLLEMRQLG